MSLSIPSVTTLATELADELGEDASDTEVMARINTWLNDTFEDIMARQPDWKFAREYKQLIMTIPYTTGTVTITQDSAIVTGSGTSWNSTWRNRIFWVDGSGVNYKVASVDSATQLTLDVAIQEASASAQGYTLVQNRYPLDNQAYESGVVQFVNQYGTAPINEIDVEIFLQRYPRLRDLGDPTEYAVWGQEDSSQTDGTAPMVYFNRYPSSQRAITYYYHKQFDRISGGQKFPLPQRHHRLVLKAGVKLRSGRFDNEQQSELREEYEGYLKLMIQDNASSGDRQRQFRETDVPKRREGSARLPSGYPDRDL